MKIKKEYSFTNNRQIWRLLPTESGKLVIEDRDTEVKEAFYNCIDISSGKKIFRNLQMPEKFWIGIETVYKDLIVFNLYMKPDMPQHQGIIAFDIASQNVLWNNPNYVFLFIKDEKVYCYRQKFEGRSYFVLDYKTGVLIEEINDYQQINILRNDILPDQNLNDCLFPQRFYDDGSIDPEVKKLLDDFKTGTLVVGPMEFIHYSGLILLNTFEPDNKGSLTSFFRAIDIKSGKVIFEEILYKNAKNSVPDSFFIKNNFIILLHQKNSLLVYSMR